MTLKELDLQNAVYGDIPESFQHRVQYALRRTQKEEVPVKRFTIRTAVIVLVLVAITGVALAAISSITAERFGQLYGADWKDAALQGDIDATNRSKQLGDVVYQLDDVIVTGITLGGITNENSGEVYATGALRDIVCTRILASGTIRPVEGANVVLISEDYLTTDPWNFNPYYGGHDNIPADAVSVKDKAALTDATILCTTAIANGLVDAEGNLLDAVIGCTEIVQEDGTLVFTMEIDLAEPIPRQDEYTLSVYLSNHQVTPEGEHLMDTRLSEDWVFTIAPTKLETK